MTSDHVSGMFETSSKRLRKSQKHWPFVRRDLQKVPETTLVTLKEGDERRNTLRETQAKTKGKADRYNVSIWFKAYCQISSMMQILENRRGMENRRQHLYSIFRLLSFASTSHILFTILAWRIVRSVVLYICDMSMPCDFYTIYTCNTYMPPIQSTSYTRVFHICIHIHVYMFPIILNGQVTSYQSGQYMWLGSWKCLFWWTSKKVTT